MINKTKKRLSVFLVLSLLLTMLQTTVLATDANIKVVDLSADSTGGINTGQIICLGENMNDGSAPIRWRVVRNNAGKVTLFSDAILENKAYDSSLHRNWSGSEICSYLNGTFLTSSFTETERGYISTYSEAQESGHNAGDTFTPNQKIVLPSFNEVKNGGIWGMNANSQRASTYAWWLRSPGFLNYGAACVGEDGYADSSFGIQVDHVYGIRPTLKLDLPTVLFTSDASGSGGKSNTASPTLMSAKSINNDKKLTFLHSSQTLASATVTGKYIPGSATNIRITYSGANTGANQYLSAMITDATGALKYYGSLKALSNVGDASGTSIMTIPAGFDSTMTLKIFTEQLNGDYKTDYASTPITVAVNPTTSSAALELNKGDRVYFGEYNNNPIIWSVMDKDMINETIALFSDAILENNTYDSNSHDNWSSSDLCSYLNNTFLTSSFTVAEQEYISTYSGVQEQGYNAGDTFTPNQKIVLPSVSEVKDGGTWEMDNSSRSSAYNWWLRSPGANVSVAASVYSGGAVNDNGLPVSNSFGVRPTLKLNLSTVLFASVTHITAPTAITNVVNGAAKEATALGLPTTVGIQRAGASDTTLNVTWDVASCSYDPNVTNAQTFTVNGKVRPNGVMKLASGLSLNTSISVTVNAKPPSITTDSLASGMVGTAYSQTLVATGGTPIAWSVTAGSLPNGLSLNITSGEISGTPATVGTFNFTVKADNVAGSDTKALSIEISTAPLAQVTGVALSNTGVATWDNVDHESNFEVQLYKDGSAQGSVVTVAADTLSYNFLSDMRTAGVGVYTVKVTAKGNGSTYTDGAQSAASLGQNVVQLGAVSSGLIWVGNIAHWDAGEVANAISYDVQLYKGGIVQGGLTNVLATDAESGVDFGLAITTAGGGTYTYKVTAKGNAALVLDGTESAVSNSNVVASLSGVTATNGTVNIVLDEVPTVAPVSEDFTATTKIDGGASSSLNLTDFVWNEGAQTVSYTFAPVASTEVDQSVAIGLCYKGGATTWANAFTVTGVPIVASVSSVTVTNGTGSIILDQVPTVVPVVGDFTATTKIDGGTENSLMLTNFIWNEGAKTVSFAFTPIEKTAVSQSVVIGVTYRGTTTQAPAFMVESIAAPVTVPGVPTNVTATAGDGRAIVSFTPPASDGGSPITLYTVTANPGGITATGPASPIIVTGLTTDSVYTFTVTAANEAGESTTSSPSNSVTPVQILTDAECVDLDAASLAISFASGEQVTNVTQNITLPLLGSNGTKITWSTSQPSIISHLGGVTRPSGIDTEVTLTATITKGTEVRNRTFIVTVLKQPVTNNNSGGGGGGSTTPPAVVPTNNAFDIEINGQKATAGTTDTSTVGNQTVTKVILDD